LGVCNWSELSVLLQFEIHNLHAKGHQTLRVTPAMEAGLTDHVWSLAELLGLLDRKLS
jgi:hypothetical protein